MSTMPTAIRERRRSRRVPRFRERALFRFENDQGRPRQVRGFLENISETGAAVRTALTPPAGTYGEITIEFQGFQLVAEARVVRATQRGFALEFTDLQDLFKDAVGGLQDDWTDAAPPPSAEEGE